MYRCAKDSTAANRPLVNRPEWAEAQATGSDVAGQASFNLMSCCDRHMHGGEDTSMLTRSGGGGGGVGGQAARPEGKAGAQ